MGKKILKIVGVVVLIFFIALVTIPFLFKDKIKDVIVNVVNNNLDATLAIEKVDISLLANFPKATVQITDLALLNKAPFEGDTLFFANQLNLKMSVMELFKSDGSAMEIEGIYAKNAIANIIFNQDGVGNFDIALASDEPETPETVDEASPISLAIDSYKIDNLRFTYLDQASKMKLVLDSIMHTGSGSFKDQVADLDTKTTTSMFFEMDSVKYLNHVKLNLDAIIGVDLNKQKYSFKENKALVNQLPLEFDGFIQLTDAGQTYDLSFKTPESTFKNFLGLIPEAYSGLIADVKTDGDFSVAGFVKGDLTDKTIPTFDIAMKSNNASFQYPDLPKAVRNIFIDVDVVNKTGLLNDTYVDVNKFSFQIDQDKFDAAASIKNMLENPLIDAKLNGNINLANLTQAYPVKLDFPLSGLLSANVAVKFDMNSIEKEQYQNVYNSGSLSLTNFKYTGSEMANPVLINKAAFTFNTKNITLNTFDFKTGKSDLNVTGALDNFYGFLFKKETLKGNFNVVSNYLAVGDFMTSSPADAKPETTTEKAETAKPATENEALKVPSFLDCTLNAKANTVVYDNLNLKNVQGTLVIKDEAVSLKNVKTDIFSGLISMNGTVSTKSAIPTFDVNLGLNHLDVPEAFTQLEFLSKVAPIAKVISGFLNSEVSLSGKLNPQSLTPEVNSLTGDLIGQIQGGSINTKNSKLLTALSSDVKFIDPDKINLKDIKAHLSFADGKVNIKPFTIKYQDINVTVGGQHGFDQQMNYDLNFNVPAKYFGKDVEGLLSKLSTSEQAKIQDVPIKAVVTGTFNAPKVTTDMGSAVKNLTNQIVEQQKEKAVEKGKEVLTDKLTDLLGGKKDDAAATPADSAKAAADAKKADDIKKAANSIKDLFKKKEKE
ncbi:AsmA family protein [Flavobacterium agricola]|uniref:AsmA family protein n=1 Tax=Flavobacterium agricola TaxID=2870839 RepID=A0ABY6LWZ7_9FLAO|nr:AsmA family protein [Flavobacterium agricola]UYW00691.1 AsmA family protein [Flavobacterium agricola]